MVRRTENEEPEEEEMEGEEMGGGWGNHEGWGGMNKCGCPMCRWMMMMKKMAMMGGGMMSGMMGMPWMRHMGGMGMGTGMGMPGMGWRKFMSSEEKVARLEDYLKDLQMEEKAVREKIDFLRNRFEKE